MKQSAPLSQSQYGLYVECAAHQGEPCYNLPYIYELDGSLDGERLCQAVQTAFKAHPTMFTRIELNDDGEPIQTLDLDNEQFSVEIKTINDIEEEKPRLVQPFNIYGDRLFHVSVMHDGKHYYLFVDYHHLIVDGTSMQILLHDIDRAYRGESIDAEQLTLMQVAMDEAEKRKTDAFQEAKQWYAKNFDCSDTFTQLNPDLAIGAHSEDSTLRTLSIEMQQVDDYCKSHGVYRSNFFTSAFAFLLDKYNS